MTDLDKSLERMARDVTKCINASMEEAIADVRAGRVTESSLEVERAKSLEEADRVRELQKIEGIDKLKAQSAELEKK